MNMPYIICSQESLRDLVLEVNQCIQDGYICQGGVSAVCQPGYDSMKYIQAMVKTIRS
jgi:hypothetical protein